MQEKDTLAQRALQFATHAHDGQKRKYDGAPYISHPIEVADIVSRITDDPTTIAAAYLHDVVEDCDVTLDQIREAFGPDLAEVVRFVTNISTKEDGNRRRRKAIDRAHFAKGCARAQNVKVADIISNLRMIVARDPEFAQVYIAEKQDVIDVLTNAGPALIEEARNIIAASARELEAHGRPVKWNRT